MNSLADAAWEYCRAYATVSALLSMVAAHWFDQWAICWLGVLALLAVEYWKSHSPRGELYRRFVDEW